MRKNEPHTNPLAKKAVSAILAVNFIPKTYFLVGGI
jgi:hypothetical protein